MPRSLHDALLDAAPTAGRELTTEVLVSKATTRRRRRRVVVVSTLAMLVLAAGVAVAAGRPDSGRQVDTDLGTTVPAPTPTTEPGLVTPSADPLVSCNPGDDEHAFRASMLNGPTFGQMNGPGLPVGVQAVLDDPNLVRVDPGSSGWRLVSHSDTSMTLIEDEGAFRYQVVVVMAGETWRFGSSGGCMALYVVQPGLAPATLSLTAPADPMSTSLSMGVDEMACHGGLPVPADQLVGPQVQSLPDRVIVTYAVRPVTDATGGAVAMTCPGTGPTRVAVPLSEPLGSRLIMDGSVFPPRIIPH